MALFKLLKALLVSLETKMLCCFLELLEHLLLEAAKLLRYDLLVFFHGDLLLIGLFRH